MRIRSRIGNRVPAPVIAIPALSSNSVSVVVTTTVTGRPWWDPSSPRGQGGAQAGAEGVMVALRIAASVTVGRVWHGFTIDHRALIARVAHAGGGEFGEHRIEVGAGFWIH